MNQEKIGKLIAKLRKAKGLTQQELGDKVGVGYRAVSKWETGLTMPDISIINELCEILGITSDELLKGELSNQETKHRKHSKRKLLLIIPIVVIIAIIIGLLLREYNKTYEYTLDSNTENYRIRGKAVFKGRQLSLNINKIVFYDVQLNQTVIKDYKYKITSNNKVIFGFGYRATSEPLNKPIMISKFMDELIINYTDEINLNRQEIINNNMVLELTFTDTNDNIINKKIEIALIPKKEVKSTTQVE